MADKNFPSRKKTFITVVCSGANLVVIPMVKHVRPRVIKVDIAKGFRWLFESPQKVSFRTIKIQNSCLESALTRNIRQTFEKMSEVPIRQKFMNGSPIKFVTLSDKPYTLIAALANIIP